MNPVPTIPEGRPDEACLNIIKSHFQVASTIPLQGTPTTGCNMKRQTAVIYGVVQPQKPGDPIGRCAKVTFPTVRGVYEIYSHQYVKAPNRGVYSPFSLHNVSTEPVGMDTIQELYF
ncbi:hypothetical protein ACLB1E_34100 [Escherichia coli]